MAIARYAQKVGFDEGTESDLASLRGIDDLTKGLYEQVKTIRVKVLVRKWMSRLEMVANVLNGGSNLGKWNVVDSAYGT